MTDEPWNHNSAFYGELVAAVPHLRARVLDVGCGNGALVERLAAVAGEVVGIDSDPSAVAAARDRLRATENARVVSADVLAATGMAPRSFDLVVSVAALHHLPLRPALELMRDLLVPGGHLRVIGLAVSGGGVDRVLALSQVVPVRIVGLLRREASDSRMILAPPRETVATIRRVAADVIPGARIRRRLYFRYSLEWTRPA